MTEVELKTFLERSTGLQVKLTVTKNRSSVIKSQYVGEQDIDARVHRIFLNAPDNVLRALGGFLKKSTKRNRATIDEYILENLNEIKQANGRKPKNQKLTTKGDYHDLEAIFNSLNKRFFKGKCDAAYTWGKKVGGRKRRTSIRYGSYDFSTNTIRIHPALDRSFVPRYVVETILYHEMLHWYIPPKGVNGRQYVHTNLFRQIEKQHPQYERAELWRNNNLHRLLRN